MYFIADLVHSIAGPTAINDNTHTLHLSKNIVGLKELEKCVSSGWSRMEVDPQ